MAHRLAASAPFLTGPSAPFYSAAVLPPCATRSDRHNVALEKLVAFEQRIKELVKTTQELRQKNQLLEQELRGLRARLASQDDANRRWERERAHIRTRVEKVLGEIELLEAWEETKEEVSLG